MSTAISSTPFRAPDMQELQSQMKLGNQQQHMMSLAAAAPNRAQLQKAAQEYEGVFLTQMLEHMFAGIETNELFGGGEAEDIYRSMMIDEYGKQIAKSGGIGIADQIVSQLIKTQEVE